VLLRDWVESAVRRWHSLELAHGRDPVIDYDCAPNADHVEPYPDQVAALDELVSLRAAADDGPLLASLEAHTTYLAALIGQQIPLSDYVARTQGCGARGWSPSYVAHRKEVAQEALASLDVGWDASTWERLRELEGAVPAAEAGLLVREYADEFEPAVRKLTGATAEFRLSVETVEEDAYWSYWLDGAGHDARLRMNLQVLEVRVGRGPEQGVRSTEAVPRCGDADPAAPTRPVAPRRRSRGGLRHRTRHTARTASSTLDRRAVRPGVAGAPSCH